MRIFLTSMQLVQFLCRIEVIDVAGLFRCIRYVLRCQFLYAAQHCVRAWDTGLRTLRKRQQNTEKMARIISLY